MGHRSPAISRASQGGTSGRWPCRSLVRISRIRTLPRQKHFLLIVAGPDDFSALTVSEGAGRRRRKGGSWARLSLLEARRASLLGAIPSCMTLVLSLIA